MDLRRRIIRILTNIGWILLGSVLNISYPNIFAISNLLPNFLIVFSVIISFDESFINILPIVIFGGILDSIWRGINPGINTISLIVACGMTYFILHRFWKSSWVVIISVFLATVVYFLISYLLVYFGKVGILTYNEALNFGVIQGFYNSLWSIPFILLVRNSSR